MSNADRPAEPAPSPETFGELYKALGQSPAYGRMMADVYGPDFGRQLSMAGPDEVRLLAARAAIAPGQLVADFCCGMGAPTVLLAAEYGCRVVGVDWSRQAIEICRKTAVAAQVGHRVQPVVGDITRPLFADDTFHSVVSIDGFYFGVDLPWLYREIFRVLRPGGRLAFYFNVPSQAVVDASSPERQAHRESHRIDHRAALAAAGFIYARAEDRTFAERRLLAQLLAGYDRHGDALAKELGPDVAHMLRDEVAQTLQMTEAGAWPRFLFTARKPSGRAPRRR